MLCNQADEKESQSQVESLVSGIRIYPNPAKNELTVQLLESGFDQLVLYNPFGESVMKKQLSGKKQHLQLNVSGLPSGLYFFTLYDNGRRITSEKVMIVH